jgi:hypothetical protein
LERAGAELVLLRFSPRLEWLERFAEQVIPRLRAGAPSVAVPAG